MNRAIKVAGLTVAGLAAVTGITLVAARLIRNYRSWPADWLQPEYPAAAGSHERKPTRDEYALILLVRDHGWPIPDRYALSGTDAEGPYLLVPLGSGTARLQFVPGSTTEFRIGSWKGEPAPDTIATPNPNYYLVVGEIRNM